MPPKHRQLHAPHPKASGNAFQALVDPPNDGNHFSFDGGDEQTDENDDNTIVIANLCESIEMQHKNEKRLYKIEERVIGLGNNQYQHFDGVNSKMDNLLQKMDAAWTENTMLHKAYHASREETAALKAAVDALTQKLEENTVISAPPSPGTMASSTTMEEMTMQLFHVQHDVQDVLDAVRNPPGKRKQRTSGQDNEPTTPTNRRPATQGHRDASPEPSLMHSCYATSTTQEALDALRIKFPPCRVAIASTSAKPTPPPSSPAQQPLSKQGSWMAMATPPCDHHNHHRSHRFFHRIRIRHTQLRTSVNFQSVTRRFHRLSLRN
jgi:hypothetical protein